MVIISAALVYETSSPPIWIGMIRSIANCSSGRSSIATSVLVVVPRILAQRLGGAVLDRPPVPHRRADAGDRAIHVQHTRGNPEEKQHNDPPWPRAEPMINGPPQRRRDTDRDHQFDADTEAETDTLL